MMIHVCFVYVYSHEKVARGGSSEQPLDLSTKKSTPSNSPRPSTVTSELMTSDSEDAVGMSLTISNGNGNQPLNLVSVYMYACC